MSNVVLVLASFDFIPVHFGVLAHEPGTVVLAFGVTAPLTGSGPCCSSPSSGLPGPLWLLLQLSDSVSLITIAGATSC